MSDPIMIELTGDEALVLFEWLAGADAARLGVGEAEERVLWNIEAVLEKSLVAPFANDYAVLVEGARRRIVEGGAVMAHRACARGGR